MDEFNHYHYIVIPGSEIYFDPFVVATKEDDKKIAATYPGATIFKVTSNAVVDAGGFNVTVDPPEFQVLSRVGDARKLQVQED